MHCLPRQLEMSTLSKPNGSVSRWWLPWASTEAKGGKLLYATFFFLRNMRICTSPRKIGGEQPVTNLLVLSDSIPKWSNQSPRKRRTLKPQAAKSRCTVSGETWGKDAL